MSGEVVRLNDCGCCEGINAATPATVDNRPGLAEIAYRVGTHSQFKETLLAGLSSTDFPALGKLSTRANDDFTIALLDGCATMLDVLTFYQERVANEAFLRTAIERRSVLELARLIGYQPRPGVAASTHLAFILEDAKATLGESPPPFKIEAGTRVQSVAGPDEEPQTFETVEAIEGRAAWSALRPRLVQPQELSTAMGSIMLQGTANNLKPGDELLIDAVDGRELRTIINVAVDNAQGSTRVDFENPALSPTSFQRPIGLPQGALTNFKSQTLLNEKAVLAIIKARWREEDFAALANIQNWSISSLAANINKQVQDTNFTGGSGIFAFRQRAAVFGYNAPKWDSLPANIRYAQGISAYKNDNGKAVFDEFRFVEPAFPDNWENRTLSEDSGTSDLNSGFIYLDRVYPNIAKGSWLVMSGPSVAVPEATLVQVAEVQDNVETARSDFAISAKVSRLSVENRAPFNTAFSDFRMRTTNILAESENLPLAQVPIEDDIENHNITLDQAHFGLKSGRKVIVTGERSDLRGTTASETRTLREVLIEDGFSVLLFDEPLAYSYLRRTVTINANVARATHGESAHEILGSGDARIRDQRFVLKQPPLTYISAETPTGALSTLEVRVNDIRWQEATTLFGHAPNDRGYVAQLNDDGQTTVLFGDGVEGARLPTGQENVRALYRKGIGLAGNVRAGQLTTLLTRPLGLKEVVNPEAAAGGDDRERLADARQNAPRTVLTLDRVVSLQDYEDSARGFAGIAKALATWIWLENRRAVFLTIAAPGGKAVDVKSDTFKNLLKSMRQQGDPYVPVKAKSYVDTKFRVKARVKIDAAYLMKKVLSGVEDRLHDSFSFASREFGQPVTVDELIAAMHGEEGVIAVDIDALYRAEPGANADWNARLIASLPVQGSDGESMGAELLTLDPGHVELSTMQ